MSESVDPLAAVDGVGDKPASTAENAEFDKKRGCEKAKQASAGRRLASN